MATLDRRLLPLIETLVASGADWLAFELAEIIQSGRPTEETPDALQRARTLVRDGLFASISKIEFDSGVFLHVDPIAGDEQIDWAIKYLNTRLEDTVALLISAIDGLDRTVKESTRAEAPVGEEAIACDVTVVLQDDETTLHVDRSGAIKALNALQTLKSALLSWRNSVRDGQI